MGQLWLFVHVTVLVPQSLRSIQLVIKVILAISVAPVPINHQDQSTITVPQSMSHHIQT